MGGGSSRAKDDDCDLESHGVPKPPPKVQQENSEHLHPRPVWSWPTSGDARGSTVLPLSENDALKLDRSLVQDETEQVVASALRTAGGAGASEAENLVAPTRFDVVQMAAYLGMDPVLDKDLLWVAEEALVSRLPGGWSEHRAEDGSMYYFNQRTGRSQWEHPLDAYHRFLFHKMKKLSRRNQKAPHTVPHTGAMMGPTSKDRELVDILWAMEQGEHPLHGNVTDAAAVTSRPSTRASTRAETIDSRATSRSDVDSILSRQRHNVSSLSMTSKATSRTDGSRNTISSFCNTPIDFEVEGVGPVPEEVKEIASYLGINVDQLSTPVSPEEVREMAEYLGIDCQSEGFLLQLAKMALQAPLPKNWEIYKDEKGEPFYYNRSSRQTSYRHPADEYFMRRVQTERERHKIFKLSAMYRDSEPWLDFLEPNGERYFYNFATGQRSKNPPSAIWNL